jgi:hypothetical protein
MVTTVPWRSDVTGASRFIANAVPDSFDERDLKYRPRLELLPETFHNPSDDDVFKLLQQDGQSWTRQARAALVNMAPGSGRSGPPGGTCAGQSAIEVAAVVRCGRHFVDLLQHSG